MRHHAVTRTPGYFDHGLFGWYHDCRWAEPRDCVAVICPPFGAEYSSSHRTLRHLADRLARQGIPTLRFDYHGTGDSPGTGVEPGIVRRWEADIVTAIAHARTCSGRRSVALIGVRLGGMLAALASANEDVDLLVLWNAPVTGRSYVRELEVIARTASIQEESEAGTLESGGLVTAAETLEELKRLDLTKAPVKVGKRALVVSRSDLAGPAGLAERFDSAGIAHERIDAAGWVDMMADPHDTVVPFEALDAIAEWARRHSMAAEAKDSKASMQASLSFTTPDGAAIDETVVRFGPENRLFGILCSGRARSDVAIVMPNAGAQPHFGPNRLYVTMARELAGLGLPSLRFDILGLGDSVLEDGAENRTYPEWAVSDARAAMNHLRETRGFSRFIVMGLCSGAYTAFRAGLEVDEHDVARLVMINPLTYRWREGMSLGASRQYFDVVRYRKSARDPRSWLKLLRGEVAFRVLAKTMFAHAARVTRSYVDAIRETLFPATASELAREFRRLGELKRPVTLVVSENDPGYDMLIAGAQRAARRALRNGELEVRFIEAADHTFSRQGARRRLVSGLKEALGLDGPREA